MAGVRSIFKRFQSECETNDQHIESELRTQYFKSGFDKTYTAVVELFSSPSYKILSQSKERGEITIEYTGKPHMLIIATIVMVRPFEIAVDFKLSSNNAHILGIYPILKKQIANLYSNLGQQLQKA